MARVFRKNRCAAAVIPSTITWPPEYWKSAKIRVFSKSEMTHYANLAVVPHVGLFDRGLSLVEKGASAVPPELQLTRGDARSLHIAAASVVAKVGRDAIMARLEGRFPGYGLARHKGYGTAAHRDSIRSLGPSAVHRRSFCTRIEGAKSRSC